MIGVVFAWAVLAAPPGDALYLATAQAQETGVVTTTTARRVFSGRQARWPDGKRVRIVLPPRGSPAMQRLCEFVRMPESAYRHFLNARAFAGRMPKPLEAGSQAELLDLLNRTPGAVAPMLEPPMKAGVRLVKVPE